MQCACIMCIKKSVKLLAKNILKKFMITLKVFFLYFPGISVMVQGLVTVVCQISASHILHENLMTNILRAPMSFYDTTPLGRIVNRFSRDVDVLDVNIPLTTRIWLGTMSAVITTIIIISYSTPIFLAVLVPLGVLYFFLQVWLP